MPAFRSFRYALAAVIVAAAIAPATAAAQQSVVASGTGEVKPEPSDRQDNDWIAAAVGAAKAKALPLAITEARQHAAELATAAGVTLGSLMSIADAPLAAFPFIYSGQEGTFGDGKFCGQVRNTKLVRRNGVRRRVATKGTHKVCRVPPEVAVSVSLTFAVA